MALAPRPLANDLPQPKTVGDLDLLNQGELLRLRREIDARLDLGTMKDIDLGEELTVQLRTVKELQREASDATDVPFNQKAQTAAVVQSMLKEIVRMQKAVHDAQFAKSLENLLISSFLKCEAAADPELQAVLKQVKDLFFEQYEQMLVLENQA